MPYDIAVVTPHHSGEVPSEARGRLIYNLRRFTGLSGCGFCSLWDLRSAGVHVLKSCARDDNLLRHHNVRYLYLVRFLLSNEGIDKAQFQAYAREIRARMYYDFLAENLVKRVASGVDDSQLGREVRALVGQSWLLSCDPPFSCYLPDCLVEGSGNRVSHLTGG